MNDARLVELLAQAKKDKVLKNTEETDRLYYMGVRDARGLIERERKGRGVDETSQDETGGMDFQIWEDDPWCMGFTNCIWLMTGDNNPPVKILKHESSPVGIHEPHFMQSLLDMRYIRERTSYGLAQPLEGEKP